MYPLNCKEVYLVVLYLIRTFTNTKLLLKWPLYVTYTFSQKNHLLQNSKMEKDTVEVHDKRTSQCLLCKVVHLSKHWENIFQKFMKKRSNSYVTFVNIYFLKRAVWKKILLLFTKQRNNSSLTFVVATVI